MMRFCCERHELEAGLVLIENAKDATGLIPVLSGFLFRTVAKNSVITRFPERSMQRLKTIHGDVLEKIVPLVNKDFTSQREFCDAILTETDADFLHTYVDDILKSTQDFLFVASSDTTITTSTYVPVSIDEPGELVIPSDMLDITKKLPDDTLHIAEKDEYWIDIACGSFRSDMACLSAEKYIDIPLPSDEYNVVLPQSMLRECLKKTRIAISNDESRQALTGLSLALLKDTLHFVSTDGYRLAYQRAEHITIPMKEESEFDVIIPQKVVKEVIKACDDTGDVKIAMIGSKIHFYFGTRTTIISNLIDQQYITYRDTILGQIHDSGRFSVTFPGKANLTKAIQRIALVSGDTRQVNMSIEHGHDGIQLFTNKREKGSASELVDAMVSDHEEEQFKIGYNYTYLLDAFAVMKGEPIFSMMDGKSVTFITSTSEFDTGFTYMIMPMHVGDVPQLGKNTAS